MVSQSFESSHLNGCIQIHVFITEKKKKKNKEKVFTDMQQIKL